MNLPAPLPVAKEQLVIVEIGDDGYADTKLVHLPARRQHDTGWGPSFAGFEFPPATWPSACRQLASGSVYAHAGMLASAHICLACEAAA